MPSKVEVKNMPRRADIAAKFINPLGSMIFRARLARIAMDSESQARKEYWNLNDDKVVSRRMTRRDELLNQGRKRLVEKTLDRGFGSERFMAKLLAEADELEGVYPSAPDVSELPATPAGYEVTDYPDYSEPALFDD